MGQWTQSGQMGRLRVLRPRLAQVAARIAVLTREDLERARDASRDREQATQALYKIARSQRLRLRFLARDLYTCWLCGRIEGSCVRPVCDQVEPHRGDVARFWAGPFQTLCKSCHDGDKQRMEWWIR